MSERFGMINNHWLEWFVGLYEGDGSLNFFSEKGFRFSITSTDLKTLENIKQTLGFGRIRKFPFKEKHLDKWNYEVEDRFNIYVILSILNGNLVLYKRYYECVKLINIFNNYLYKGKPYMYTIIIKYEQVIPNLNDAWLSGFVDAEGHFGCPVEVKRKHIPYYISIIFEVGQNDELWLFKHLQKLFKGGIIHSKRNKKSGKIHNRIIFKGSKIGKNNVSLVFSYFDRFSLRTKHNIFIKWRIMHKYLLDKKHLDRDYIPKLIKLARDINSKT